MSHVRHGMGTWEIGLLGGATPLPGGDAPEYKRGLEVCLLIPDARGHQTLTPFLEAHPTQIVLVPIDGKTRPLQTWVGRLNCQCMNDPVRTAESGRRRCAFAAWRLLTPASATLVATLALAGATPDPSQNSRVAAAAIPASQGILEALPTADHLGINWTREVSLLFDSRSDPTEMPATTVPLPDALVLEQRAAVRDPAGKVSAWANVQYDLRSAHTTNRLDVQIYRYRSKEALIEDFDHLLALDTERYEKTMITDLAAVAVAFRDARTGSGTLWFRIGNYRVWISPGSSFSWGSDPSLRHLAWALIRQLGTATHRNAKANRISHSLQTSEHSWTAIHRETVHRDYPSFGLPGVMKGGETFEFKWRAPERSPWRLCLIYSKNTATSVLPAGTARFEARGRARI
jgi:hypothetical protein